MITPEVLIVAFACGFVAAPARRSDGAHRDHRSTAAARHLSANPTQGATLGV